MNIKIIEKNFKDNIIIIFLLLGALSIGLIIGKILQCKFIF